MSVHRLKRPLRSRWWPRVTAVILGAAGVWWGMFPSASASTNVLVAKHNIFEGDVLSAADFESRNLNLADSAQVYLATLPDGSLARREIIAGELVVKTAIGRPAGSQVPIALTLTQSLPHQVVAGRTVDVWSTSVHLGQVDSNPEPIALQATVTALSSSSSLGQNRTTAELLVSSQYVSPLLLAQADGSVLSLVLNPTAADG
jgi:hypothetical protein